ncbi:bifunctional DNA-formamidopyrimidine glycosylase/DNA-(apurinic or apyrimidinic site) lyase [Alicyclobacillus dauci]|uniref:Formamidopyrimidine-DNA glycosylase n=1 Tax=Alicyclobacillus dauci TaxID=1475485 RepID=A0ABY6Z517_9BACL|nr:bifunctional DNA-formamidopyrimidine glycosylase/DNA-(apurinic or apyrimidinic site) lyase [Alicyclobacillus dauci]WAH37951.1 bifunctional DNA-formamidopyrimidine glycosylase/DNA-(apurinic or apyrimidinic site) lyase [Alicyclobacillus dauci]
MPELPEVETIRRGLTSLVVGKTVTYVTVRLPRIIRFPSVPEFEERLVGRTIHAIHRRGKYLVFDMEPFTMISHLRMEGQYRVADRDEPLASHTHVIFGMSDGTELRYRDVRQFGTMDALADDEERPSGLVNLGPEPFDPVLTPNVFYTRLHSRSAPIKSVLLDQVCIAGLGNIYVDEALFLSGIHPLTKASRIGQGRCELLLGAIRNVLSRAIEAGGSSVRTYVNGYGRHGGFQMQLNVYARQGQPCFVCGQAIEKIKLGGRGTHFCPHCQARGGRRRNDN